MVCGIPKKVIQRYFYKFKVPLRYKDIEKLLDLCSTDYNVTSFPRRYNADALIRIKRSLEDCRRRDGIFTGAGAEAETNLLEAAADMGDNAAIALLCGARLRQKDVTNEEMDHGSMLLKQLMDQKFPLAFKVSGDLAYTMGHFPQALKFYEMALSNGLEDNRLVVECFRNIGHIQFKKNRLIKSRHSFSKACMLAEDSKQVSDCHYLLAQLRETDRVAARKHLEIAASHGLHEAFLVLGNLLLNWFGEAAMAREWFKLAVATDKSGQALVGLLDAATRLNDRSLAMSTLRRIELHPQSEMLLKSRQRIVKGLKVTKPEIPRPGRFDF